jgi:hypothetical protein
MTRAHAPVAPRSRSSVASREGSGLARVFVDRLEHGDGARRHDCGDCVLIDELGVSVAAKQHTEIVKPSNEPLQFHAVDEKNRDRRLGLSHVIEKRVLEVLRLLGCHSYFRSLGLSGRPCSVIASASPTRRSPNFIS